MDVSLSLFPALKIREYVLDREFFLKKEEKKPPNLKIEGKN